MAAVLQDIENVRKSPGLSSEALAKEGGTKNIRPEKLSQGRSGLVHTTDTFKCGAEVLEDIENVRKSPGGTKNICPEKLSQGRSGLVHTTDTFKCGAYIEVRFKEHSHLSSTLLRQASLAARQAELYTIDVTKQIRLKTAQQIHQVRSRARKRGYGDGLLEGHEKLANTLTDLHNHHRRMMHQLEGQCLKLVIQVAEKIIQDELHQNPASISKRIHTAMEGLFEQSLLEVELAPQDRDSVSKYLRSILNPCPTITICESLTAGEVKLHTSAGTISLSCIAELQELHERFQARHGANNERNEL